MSKTKFNTQLSVLIPETKRDDANAYLGALGFGPTNFSIDCGDMCGMSMPDDGRVRVALEAVPEDVEWSEYGLTKAKAKAVVKAVKLSKGSRGAIKGKKHFDDHTEAHGVKRRARREPVAPHSRTSAKIRDV